MTYDPNATWTTATEAARHLAVYYVEFDGLATKLFSTAALKTGTAHTICMQPPAGAAAQLDILAGTRTLSSCQFELLDVAGEITDLIATEADGAPVGTLVNRKVTVYAGYRDISFASYAPVYTGVCRGVRANATRTGYVFDLVDASIWLDGEIMTLATSAKPVTIRGNVCNIYWAVLSGTFSTSDPNFPMESVSTATGSSEAPDGLSLASSWINADLIGDQRDNWHAEEILEFEFRGPISARTFLQTEVFRAYQGWPAVSQDGKLGIRFFVPSIPEWSPPDADTTNIVRILGWQREFRDHLNKFRFWGDYDIADNEFDTELYGEDTSADTADRTATGETIEYKVESKGARTAYSGVQAARELCQRIRSRYLYPPARLQLQVHFTLRAIEEGDVVQVTLTDLPNLQTGERGVAPQNMTCVAVSPDFAAGLLTIDLVDAHQGKYGLIGAASLADYTSASAIEQQTYAFIGNASDNEMSNGDAGYRLA